MRVVTGGASVKKMAPPPLRPSVSLCLKGGSVNENGIRICPFRLLEHHPFASNPSPPSRGLQQARAGSYGNCSVFAVASIYGKRKCDPPAKCFKLCAVCSTPNWDLLDGGCGPQPACLPACWSCLSRLQVRFRPGGQCLHGSVSCRCFGRSSLRTRRMVQSRGGMRFCFLTFAECFGTRAIAIGSAM